VPSPCIGVCVLDPQSGLCAGCARTLDEIARWPALGDAERRALLDALASRRGGADRAAPPPSG
jgi:predicted Fe-S protein YdhL (DUF1289 family)